MDGLLTFLNTLLPPKEALLNLLRSQTAPQNCIAKHALNRLSASLSPLLNYFHPPLFIFLLSVFFFFPSALSSVLPLSHPSSPMFPLPQMLDFPHPQQLQNVFKVTYFSLFSSMSHMYPFSELRFLRRSLPVSTLIRSEVSQ